MTWFGRARHGNGVSHDAPRVSGASPCLVPSSRPPRNRSERRLAARWLKTPDSLVLLLPLPSDAESADDGAVALDVVLADVVEKPAALTDELHQAAPSVVVPLVLLQVLCQVVDPARQQGYLHLG